MAHPDRLSLLHLIVTAPNGQLSATELAGPGPTEAISDHLALMESVGVLHRLPGVAAKYRPTADGLARFGGAAIGLTTDRADAPALTEHASWLNHITDDLAAQFRGSFEHATVAKFVQESYHLLAARASVPNHLPVLAARFAAERLGALLEPQQTPSINSVLFVCVHNQGRSQIAAAIVRATVGDQVVVRTAGSAPAGGLDRTVQAELARRGLDGLVDFPRPLTEEVVKASGTVVTMGCGDACPVIPGRRYLDWDIADPVGRSPEEVSAIVDEVAARVRALLA